VWVDETRPLLQGARLTTWELQKAGVPFTLNIDSAAGFLMKQGLVDLVIVGADRITRNGDTANKIGTYHLAVLAGAHEIPFYVAAPYSTIDMNLAAGDDIEIEERDENEVTHYGNKRTAPKKIEVYNPAFDVTPNRFISAIITEKGIVKPDYEKNFSKLFS
jgi:methylthioribose-1-phosphate isomerase